jgi:hypothetical protein
LRAIKETWGKWSGFKEDMFTTRVNYIFGLAMKHFGPHYMWYILENVTKVEKSEQKYFRG